AAARKLIGAHRFAQELADHALHRGLVLHFLQQDEEFVAAEPRHDVARAYRGAQAARDLDEETVPGVVAVEIVHLLEAVQVDEHAREPDRAAAGALHGLLERRPEAGAVGEAGEWVAVGERRDAFARERALGDVAPDAAVAEERAIGGEARLAGEREIARHAVRHGARGLEIPERDVGLWRRAMRRPARLAGAHGARR